MITYLFVNELKDIELLDMHYIKQIREAYRDETREDCFCVLKKEDIDNYISKMTRACASGVRGIKYKD